MTIAITGATGFVGSHLAENLAAAGHELTVLARSPERLSWIRHLPVRVVYGDLERTDALREFVAGQEVIVHAAGLTRARTLPEFERINVDGTVRLFRSAMDRDPALRRFVFVSSMAATGPGPDASPLVEETEPHPISPYGESKLWAERALCRLADGGPLTIVRPPGVFGPRDRDVYRYFQLVARGIVPVLGWQNTASVAYVKNLVHGMRLAAESALPGTRTYFLADDGLFTWPGFAELIAQALGRRSFRVPVPRLVVSAIAAVGDLVAAISGRPALLGHQKVTELSQPNWVVSDARAREELGYRPLFTTEQGVAETVAWYVSKGWL